MIIKVLLGSGVALFAVTGLRGRNRAGRQAIRRVFFGLFLIGAGAAVIDPTAVTWLANRLGVGRGTDLLLYVLVLAFLFTTLGFYSRFKDMEDRIVQLSRYIALSTEPAAEPSSTRRSAG